MKIYAVNGSPRKQWSTALLLEHALAGAGDTISWQHVGNIQNAQQ